MKRFILVATLSPLLIGHAFTMADEDTAGKIPFKKIDHMIVVKAKIDDSPNEYNFVLDTGGLAMIDKTVVHELGLKQREPMAKITTLNLSGFLIENIFCFTSFDFGLFRRFFHGLLIRRARESGVFRSAPADVPRLSEFRMSFFPNFSGIDRALGPEVYCRRGQRGSFSG